MAKSKYIMSRLSRYLKKHGYEEITLKGLRLNLCSSPSPVLWYNVLYLNKNKTNCLIYAKGDFFILKQKSLIPKWGNKELCDREELHYTQVISMLDLLIRKEKLLKIKKKINSEQ